MIVDYLLKLSDSQALTASAASTDSIDQGDTTRYLGDGEPLALLICAEVAADFTTGDETYAFAVQCDDNSSFSSATTVISQTITAANLAAGKIHAIPLPVGFNFERYIRGYYTLGGTTPTVTISAFIAPLASVDKVRYYPKGYTIS